MNAKSFRTFVGIPALVAGAILTLVMPLVIAVAPVSAVIPGDGSSGGFGDAAWADGKHIYVNKTIPEQVVTTGLQPPVAIFNITPASFTESSTSGNVKTLTASMPKNDLAGDPLYMKDCSPVSMQVGDQNTGYQTATQATIKIPKVVFSSDLDVYTCKGYQNNTVTVALGNTYNIATNDGTTNGGSTTSPGGGATTTTQADPCPITDNSGLRWILCPIFVLGSGAVNLLGNAIRDQLYVDPDSIFGNKSLEITFNVFRNIGVALLVIAGLVMVISQAAGMELFAAYTVRKALPRIIIAAIGMALAWPVLRIILIFFNDIGLLVTQLILTIGQASNASSPVQAMDYIKAGVLGILGGAALALVYGYALITFVASAAILLLMGLFVLAVRQLVILLCILIAPLAIAASVLPGTQKLWNFWRETLLTTLLMFPLISAFLAAGAAMAYLAPKSDGARGVPGAAGAISDILPIVYYFAPYVMLPFAFKLAGGIMSTVGSLAEGGGKGIFERLKGVRQAAAAKNLQAMKNYQRFGAIDKTRFGGGLNTALGALANPTQALRGRRGILAGRQTGLALQGAEWAKNNRTFQANQNNDNFLVALANRSLAEKKLKDAMTEKEAMIARGATANELLGKQSEIDARRNGLAIAAGMSFTDRNSSASRMAGLQQLAKTGYQFGDGREGYNELASTMYDITRGNVGAYGAGMDEAQFNLKNAGRFDLAGINHGAGYDPAAGIGRADLYSLVTRGKTANIKVMGTDLIGQRVEDAQKGRAAGTMSDDAYNQLMEQAEITRQELERGWQNATGANKEAALAALKGVPGALGDWAGEIVGGQTRGQIARGKSRGSYRPDPSEIADAAAPKE